MPNYLLPAVTDREWRAISVVIPRPKAGPLPRGDRGIVSALCYAKAAGCSYSKSLLAGLSVSHEHPYQGPKMGAGRRAA